MWQSISTEVFDTSERLRQAGGPSRGLDAQRADPPPPGTRAACRGRCRSAPSAAPQTANSADKLLRCVSSRTLRQPNGLRCSFSSSTNCLGGRGAVQTGSKGAVDTAPQNAQTAVLQLSHHPTAFAPLHLPPAPTRTCRIHSSICTAPACGCSSTSPAAAACRARAACRQASEIEG